MKRSPSSRRLGRVWLQIAAALLLISMILPFAGIAPVAAAQDIHVYTYFCPDGFDSNNANFDGYKQECNIPTGIVNYDISVDNTYWGSPATTNTGESLIQGVPDGFTFMNLQQAPQGYYGVSFCAFFTTGGFPSNYVYYGDSGVAGQMGGDDNLDCYWFLVSNSPAEPTQVYVNKHWCKADFDAKAASIYDLAANCNESGDSASFVLNASDGSQVDKSIQGPGNVTWDNVVSGDVSITEQPVDGYSAPRVFCKQMNLTGDETSEDEVNVSSGYSIDQTIQSGYSLFCDWFNIPGYSSDVIVNKHWCKSDFDAYSATIYDLAANCNEDGGDVTFTLHANDGTDTEQSITDPGNLTWSGVPSGDVSITEEVPDGYGTPRVFCKQMNLTGDETSEDEVPVSDASITQTIQDGYMLFCDWFNIYESPYVGVYVRKHYCPPGYDISASYDKLSNDCTVTPKKTKFSVWWEGADPIDQETSGDQLNWEGLPPGDISVKESIPSGYGTPVVWCRYGAYDGDTGDWDTYNVKNDGSYTWQIEEYQYIECDWFNVPSGGGTPPPPTGPATLTIVKYICPTGYDVLDWDADPKKDCEETMDDVAFSLSNKGGDSKDGLTGDDGDGTLTFDKVDPGDYLLAETWPDEFEYDYDYAFILGCDSNVRSFDSYPFYPFAMIGKQLASRITLNPGETITCTWYNVPAEKETGNGGTGDASIKIIKYTCPGNSVNPSACDPAEGGVLFSLDPTDGSDPIEVETGDDGTVTTDVGAGSYDLIEEEGDWCFASSDAFDQDGFVTVESGDEVEVTIYNCEG